MNFRLKTEFSAALDFQPDHPAAKILPPFAWRNHLISGFESKQSNAASVDGDFLEWIKALYPQGFSLAETARLWRNLEKENLLNQISWEKVVSHFGWHWNQSLAETFSSILKIDLKTQKFLSQKKFGIKDWALLNSINDPTMMSDFFTDLQSTDASYNQCRKLLELAVELFLMNSGDIKKQPEEKIENWMSRLYQARYPRSVSSDSEVGNQVSTLPKLRSGKVNWQRKGDIAGLHVDFFAHSSADFENRIQELVRINEAAKSTLGESWTPTKN